jgi:hypothetical protein
MFDLRKCYTSVSLLSFSPKTFRRWVNRAGLDIYLLSLNDVKTSDAGDSNRILISKMFLRLSTVSSCIAG